MHGRGNDIAMGRRRFAGTVRSIVHAVALVLAGSAGAEAPRAPAIIVVPGGGRPVVPAYPYVYPYAQTLGCWTDVKLFNTLRDGNFPYCRQKMRYRPGALECVQVTEQVCEVVPAGATLPIQTTSPVNKQVIPCPDGPEPPVCRRLAIE
jgi:hypothetical protein